MSAYFVAQVKITDELQYQKYLEKCDEVFSSYNGKYLSVDPNPEVKEGEWNYSRMVLIEFPDNEELDRWYNSDSYQEILKFRLAGAKCDSIVINGK